MAEQKPTQKQDAIVPFWGIFLLFLGTVFLLQTIGVLPWGLWRTLGRLWPVILIAIGICLVMRRYNAWLVSLIILALFAGALGIAYAQYQPLAPVSTPAAMNFSEPRDNLRAAQVDIDFETGNLDIGSLPAGSPNFLESNASVGMRRQNGTGRITINRSGVGWPFWDKGGDRWRIGLTPGIPMTVTAKLDMANANLDLSQLQVTDLSVDADLTNSNVKLPASGIVSVFVKADLSTVEIIIPEGVAARVEVKADLSAVNVNERRFPRKGDSYVSSDYDTAKNRVELKIDADLSTVEVK